MTFSLPALGAFLREHLTFGRQSEPAAARSVEASRPAVGRAAAEDEPERQAVRRRRATTTACTAARGRTT